MVFQNYVATQHEAQSAPNPTFKPSKRQLVALFFFPKGRFTVFNLAFCGMLMGLSLIISRFITISVPFFSLRFDHLIPIVVPLIYGFSLGLAFNVLADALGQLVNGTIGMYMWQYLLSVVFITVIVATMRMAFYWKRLGKSPLGMAVLNSVLTVATCGALAGLMVAAYLGVDLTYLRSDNTVIGYVTSYSDVFFWVGIGLIGGAMAAALIFANVRLSQKNRINAVDTVYVLCVVLVVAAAIDVAWDGYAYREYLVMWRGVARYPYFYYLVIRIPEKIVVAAITFVLVAAVYNVAKHLIKDRLERITY